MLGDIISKDQVHEIVVTDVYAHVVDRMSAFSRFATRYMSKKTAPHYMRCMKHIKIELETHAESMVCIELLLGQIKQSMLEYPLTKTRVRDTFNGEMSSEVEGRKLALEHSLDLALSYRRFDGLVPVGNRELFLKWYARDTIVNNLESLLK